MQEIERGLLELDKQIESIKSRASFSEDAHDYMILLMGERAYLQDVLDDIIEERIAQEELLYAEYATTHVQEVYEMVIAYENNVWNQEGSPCSNPFYFLD